MKVWTRTHGNSFSIGIGEEPAPLVASAVANQTSSRRCYVYGHRDERGVLFYIGKGTKTVGLRNGAGASANIRGTPAAPVSASKSTVIADLSEVMASP